MMRHWITNGIEESWYFSYDSASKIIKFLGPNWRHGRSDRSQKFFGGK